jgi:hypothetical protein
VESQKVVPESIVVGSSIKVSERAAFLRPLLRASFAEANSLRESLALIRPRQISLVSKAKSALDLATESQKHKQLADQLSLFDPTAKPLEPCPVSFSLQWVDQDGKSRSHECDDWETSTAYSRFHRTYGAEAAVQILQEKYDSYLASGLALAFSTHSRRNVEYGTQNQWLLVGLIRIDDTDQVGLPL